MSERAHYAMVGVIRGGDGSRVLVPFDAMDDADAWKRADEIQCPDGFMIAQLIEITAGEPRNVFPSRSAFDEIFANILADKNTPPTQIPQQ